MGVGDDGVNYGAILSGVMSKGGLGAGFFWHLRSVRNARFVVRTLPAPCSDPSPRLTVALLLALSINLVLPDNFAGHGAQIRCDRGHQRPLVVRQGPIVWL